MKKLSTNACRAAARTVSAIALPLVLGLLQTPLLAQDTAGGAAANNVASTARTTTSARAGLSFGTSEQVDAARGETLSLEQAFVAALEGSRDLAAARDRITQAGIDIDRAWSTLRPGAYLSGSLTRNDREIVYPQPDGSERIAQQLYQHQVSFSLRQVIFQGQALPTLRALKELSAATELESERLRTEVLYAVATAFYSGLALQETLSIAERQVEDTARHLEVVEARHELEAANRLDLLRAQIDNRSAAENLRIAAAALASVKVAIGTLIGRPHDEGDFSLETPDAAAAEGLPSAVSVENALFARQDLRALERQIAAADHLITAARMAYLPSLDLSASARYSPVISFLRDDQVTWLATLTLAVPLYQGGQRRQQLQSARIQARSAERARDSLADRIRQEVLQARLDLETSSAQLERLEGTAELARETVELTRARYEVGAATSLEVTDSTARGFFAETEVLRGRLDLNLAVLALARAMGMLEEVAGLTPSPKGASRETRADVHNPGTP